MFSGLKNLESLPDISNWDIKNCSHIGGMFQGCEKLKSLPERILPMLKLCNICFKE